MHSHAKRRIRPLSGGSLYDMPVTSLAIRVIGGIRLWMEREAAHEQLHMLSDRELADIGVSRAEIDVAVDRWDGRR